MSDLLGERSSTPSLESGYVISTPLAKVVLLLVSRCELTLCSFIPSDDPLFSTEPPFDGSDS